MRTGCDFERAMQNASCKRSTARIQRTNDVDELLNAADVKRILKTSRSEVYFLAKSGVLPCVRWGNTGKRESVRFKLSDVQTFIAEHYNNSRGQRGED